MSETWTSERLETVCAADGEFGIAARFWTGGLRLEIGERSIGVAVVSGAPTFGDPVAEAPGVIALAGPEDTWALLLAARPPRFCNDLFNLVAAGRIAVRADPVLYAQYYPAVMRALELLRPADPGAASAKPPGRRPGDPDAPGRPLHPPRARRRGLQAVFRRGRLGHPAFAAAHRRLPRRAVAPPVRMPPDHRPLPPDRLRSALSRQVAAAGGAEVVGQRVPAGGRLPAQRAGKPGRGARARAAGVHGLLSRRPAGAGPGAAARRAVPLR